MKAKRKRKKKKDKIDKFLDSNTWHVIIVGIVAGLLIHFFQGK
jgi:hypothetical protein